jgi:hypothetical protein
LAADINVLSTPQIQELWICSHSIFPLHPKGIFRITGFSSSIVLKQNEENWLMANLPSPNVREGWHIKSLMLRYRTSFSGGLGGFDKIGIRDGDAVIHEFNQLSLRSNNTWKTTKLDLPGRRPFRFGLGASIHVTGLVDIKDDAPPPPPNTLPPTTIEVVSIGVEFSK